jgi:hypothetical protein
MLCWSVFHHCDKIPQKINLKEERFFFGPQLQRFQSLIIGSVVSGPVVTQNIMVGVCGRAKLLTLLYRKQRERMRKRGWGIQEKTPSDLSPIRPYLLKFPSSSNIPLIYEPINGLIHWWGQSPHNPITFQKPHLWTLLVLGTKPAIY